MKKRILGQGVNALMPLCGFRCVSKPTCCRIRVKARGDTCHVHRDMKAQQPECPCCFEPIYEKDQVTIACKHTFHLKCLSKWSKAQKTLMITCPCCRADVDEDFQWPKSIYTPNNKWVFSSRDEAKNMMAFIDKGEASCAQVANAFMELQRNILDSIYSFKKSKFYILSGIADPPPGWIGLPYLVTTRLRVGDQIHSMNNPIRMIGKIDLMDDFQSLKESLNKIL